MHEIDEMDGNGWEAKGLGEKWLGRTQFDSRNSPCSAGSCSFWAGRRGRRRQKVPCPKVLSQVPKCPFGAWHIPLWSSRPAVKHHHPIIQFHSHLETSGKTPRIHRSDKSWEDWERDVHLKKHTDTDTDTDTDTETHGHMDTWTHRHTDTQTHRHTETQTHRDADTQRHSHVDTVT